MKQIEQKFMNQGKPIEPESFLQKINPYRGSWEYIKNNYRNKGFKKIRAIGEVLALEISPGGLIYLAKQISEKGDDVRRCAIGFELVKAGIGYGVCKNLFF